MAVRWLWCFGGCFGLSCCRLYGCGLPAVAVGSVLLVVTWCGGWGCFPLAVGCCTVGLVWLSAVGAGCCAVPAVVLVLLVGCRCCCCLLSAGVLPLMSCAAAGCSGVVYLPAVADAVGCCCGCGACCRAVLVLWWVLRFGGAVVLSCWCFGAGWLSCCPAVLCWCWLSCWCFGCRFGASVFARWLSFCFSFWKTEKGSKKYFIFSVCENRNINEKESEV